MGKCIIMNPKDNVATVIKKISKNEKLIIMNAQMKAIGEITAIGDIPFAHKIGIADIKKDENIVKYGEIVGKATADIKKGEYIHTHNVVSIEGSKKVAK